MHQIKDRFSPTERKIIKIIGRKQMTIAAITDELHDTEYRPLNAGNRVSSAIRRINHKCVFYNMDWELAGDGLGRHGRTIWKSRRR